MNRMILAVALAAVSLSACTVPLSFTAPATSPPVASLPVASAVCEQINSDKFDLALKSYGAATDAVNLLIDHKVIVPGTPRALAIASANDKVLAAFALAERARAVCNAASYGEALGQINAGIAELRVALHR